MTINVIDAQDLVANVSTGAKLIELSNETKAVVNETVGVVNSLPDSTDVQTAIDDSITALSLGSAAEMWLDSCRSVGSIIGVKATSPAKAYVRNMSGTGSYSGDVTEY